MFPSSTSSPVPGIGAAGQRQLDQAAGETQGATQPAAHLAGQPLAVIHGGASERGTDDARNPSHWDQDAAVFKQLSAGDAQPLHVRTVADAPRDLLNLFGKRSMQEDNEKTRLLGSKRVVETRDLSDPQSMKEFATLDKFLDEAFRRLYKYDEFVTHVAEKLNANPQCKPESLLTRLRKDYSFPEERSTEETYQAPERLAHAIPHNSIIMLLFV